MSYEPHLRPPPDFNPGPLKDYWGSGWYGDSKKGWIVCYGKDKSRVPAPDDVSVEWYESRQAAEQSLVRSNITTKGGNRKRGYSRRRRGDKRKSRRGGKKLKMRV